MFEYFGGVTRILVPDNTKTAVIHNRDRYTQELNTVYHEMAEHYNTAILPARVRRPKDKPNAEGSVGVIFIDRTGAFSAPEYSDRKPSVRTSGNRRLVLLCIRAVDLEDSLFLSRPTPR